MGFPITDNSGLPEPETVNPLHVVALLLAAVLLTMGLALFLSGAQQGVDVMRSAVVVFGGTLVALAGTFSPAQLLQSLQVAVGRGIYGGISPRSMIQAMLKVCDVCRRDGLLGVADIRSNSRDVESVCELVGEAASDTTIRLKLEQRQSAERNFHQIHADVFAFGAFYAIVIGTLGSTIRAVGQVAEPLNPATILPFVCGASLALLLGILVGRLRVAHIRALVVGEVALEAARIMLQDNNPERLRQRLASMVPRMLRR